MKRSNKSQHRISFYQYTRYKAILHFGKGKQERDTTVHAAARKGGGRRYQASFASIPAYDFDSFSMRCSPEVVGGYLGGFSAVQH